MASLVTSVYFPTRPILGSLDYKVTPSIKTSDEKLEQAQAIGEKSKVESALDAALSSIAEVIESGSPETKGAAQLIRANICSKQGDASLAHTSADAAVDVFTGLKDKSGQAKAYHAKALAYAITDDFNHAIQVAQKALAFYTELGDLPSQFSEHMAIATWQLASRKPYASLHSGKLARNLARDELRMVAWQAQAVLVMCQSLIQSGQRAAAVTMSKDWRAEQLNGSDEVGLATAHIISTYCFLASDNPLDSLDSATSALTHVENLDNKELEFDVRYLKCQAHLVNKEGEEGAKTMRGAANLAAELGNQQEQADALRMLAFAVTNMDYLEHLDGMGSTILGEGVEAADEAKYIYSQLGHLTGEASAIMMSAVLSSHREGQGIDLVGMVQESQELYKKASNPAGEHAALSLLADLHMRVAQFAPALEFATSSIEVWETAGNKTAQAQAMQAVANIYVSMEDFESAEQHIRDAQNLAKKVGAKKLEATLAILLTKVYLEEGGAGYGQEQDLRLAAMTASDKAVALAGQSGEKDLWAIAMIWRSQVLSWAGRAEEALKSAEKAEKAFEQLGDIRNQLRSMIKRAELYRALGEKATAKEVAGKALAMAGVSENCVGLDADAQAVLDSMIERRPPPVYGGGGGGGGGRMVRKLVKKWRLKPGGGGTTTVVKKGLDPDTTLKRISELVVNVLTDDEDLTPDIPFMEAGVDSLGSVQLVTDVGKAFQMPLAPSVVFDYPSIRSLTDHLIEESGGAASTEEVTSGGGEDEWEEYDDYEEVWEDDGSGGGGEYVPQYQPMEYTPAAAEPAYEAPSAEIAPAAPVGLDPVATEKTLMELVINVLTDDEDMTPDMPFMEAGIDSLGSVQLVTDVGKAFRMPLAPSVVFDYPSVRSLCEHLVEESKG